MKSSQIVRRVLPILLLLLAGIWIVNQSGSLRQNPTANGRRVAFSPAGRSASGNAASVLPSAPLTLTVTYPPVSGRRVNFASVVEDTTPPEGILPALLPETAIPGEERLEEVRAAAMGRPPSPGVQQATTARAPAAPLVTFESIDYNQSWRNIPPDPELAVGPNQIIVAVNATVAIYDKSGNLLLGPTAAVNLFSHPACQSGLYDPNVLYDEQTDHWILAYDQGARSSGGGYCLLASRDGNPLGEWNQYFFPFNDSTVWLDFPHAGVGDRYLFMGANMFDHQSFPQFVEGRLFAFRKEDLYDPGATVSPAALRLGLTYDTPQPLHLHGARQGSWPTYGNSHYFLAEPWDGRRYTLFRWDPTVAVSNLSQVTVGTVDLGRGNEGAEDLLPIHVPQQGGDPLEANDFRPLDFEYRNGYGWTTMTVACNPGGGTANCVRWAQIDLTDASLGPAGAGLYGSAGEYRFFPDLAVNQCNDMLVGYTRSGANSYPGSWVAGRSFYDPAGTLRGEQSLRVGDRPYSSREGVSSEHPARRWGDYSGLTIDPDGITFWYVGQYSKDIANLDNTNWGTFVGAFTLSPDLSCAGPTFAHNFHLPFIRTSAPPPPATQITLKAEDFEGPFPNEWTVYDANGGAYHWGKSSCRAAGGSYSGGALAAALACGDLYPANVSSWMIYGPFDLGDATDAALQFDFWNRSERDKDSLFWGIAVDGQNLYGYASSGDTNGWQTRTLDLKDIPGLGDVRGERQVLLAFAFSSDESVAGGEGPYVDNVHLWKETGGHTRAPAAAQPVSGDLHLEPETRTIPTALQAAHAPAE